MWNASLYKEIRCPVQTPILQILFLCDFISKQFPTLLAIREIIADAFIIFLKSLTGGFLWSHVPVIKCKDMDYFRNDKINSIILLGISSLTRFLCVFCEQPLTPHSNLLKYRCTNALRPVRGAFDPSLHPSLTLHSAHSLNDLIEFSEVLWMKAKTTFH